MKLLNKNIAFVFSVITIALGVLLAGFILFFGVANLIHPDVPDNYLEQNMRVCILFILTGLVIIYSFFQPFSGGILLCICASVILIKVNQNPVAYPVIFLGGLSFMRTFIKKGVEK